MLKLNVSKCQVDSYARKANVINVGYSINDTVWSKADTIADLGIVSDKCLSFKNYIDYLAASTSNDWKLLLGIVSTLTI